jgi:hypothetical protein
MGHRFFWGFRVAVAFAACIAPNGLAYAKNDFLLRMYWEEGYFWQENYNERLYCMECSSSRCNEGDGIEVWPCDESYLSQRWQYIPGKNGAGQIKTTGRNMCISTPGRYLSLAKCDAADEDQLFVGIDSHGDRFEIESYGVSRLCLTPHHHPSSGEEVYNQNCFKARRAKTSFWMMYKQKDGNRLGEYRSDACLDGTPCDKCAGDCDDDRGCIGNLKCFQRERLDPVPGCSGAGEEAWDYCYNPQTNGSDAVYGDNHTYDDEGDYDNDGNADADYGNADADDYGTADADDDGNADGDDLKILSTSVEGCGSLGCSRCEGDCDDDSDCAGPLKCFQRDDFESVPGCIGGGKRAWDYCYGTYENMFENIFGNTDDGVGNDVVATDDDARNDDDSDGGGEGDDLPSLISTAASGCGSSGCGECEGDCDSSLDCFGDLKCFRRKDSGPVPGCSGSGKAGWDYCIKRISTTWWG